MPYKAFSICSSTPDYFVWIKYISWFYYGFEAILVKLWTNVGEIDCTIKSNCTVVPRCYKNGAVVLDKLSAKEVR